MREVMIPCHACGNPIEWAVQRSFDYKCPQCKVVEGELRQDEEGYPQVVWRVKNEPDRVQTFSLRDRGFNRRMMSATGSFKAGKCPNCRSAVNIQPGFELPLICETCGVAEKYPLFEVFEAIAKAQEPAAPDAEPGPGAPEPADEQPRESTASPFMARVLESFHIADIPLVFRIPIFGFLFGLIAAFIGVVILLFMRIFG